MTEAKQRLGRAKAKIRKWGHNFWSPTWWQETNYLSHHLLPVGMHVDRKQSQEQRHCDVKHRHLNHLPLVYGKENSAINHIADKPFICYVTMSKLSRLSISASGFSVFAE